MGANRRHQRIGAVELRGLDGAHYRLGNLTRLGQAAVDLDVEDAFAGQPVGLRLGGRIVIASQPASFVVHGVHSAGRRVEGPSCAPLTAPGRKVAEHLPRPGRPAPRVPDRRPGLDATPRQPPVHARLQALRPATVNRPQAGAGGHTGNVCAFGEHRCGEDFDLRQRPPRPVRRLDRADTGTDQRLDFACGHRLNRRDRRPRRGRPVARGHPQLVVDRDAIARAIGRGQQDMPAVLMHADKAQFLHCGGLPGRGPPGRPLSAHDRHDAAMPWASGAGRPRRRL